MTADDSLYEEKKSKWNPESITEQFHKYDVLIADIGSNIRILRHNAKLDTDMINTLIERIKKLEGEFEEYKKKCDMAYAGYVCPE